MPPYTGSLSLHVRDPVGNFFGNAKMKCCYVYASLLRCTMNLPCVVKAEIEQGHIWMTVGIIHFTREDGPRFFV